MGYPEKVDVSVKWPASPEYYNSALVVNGDGDTIANYRKSFLYYTDETWALEGKEGFFRGDIPRVGNVAMGICMDLNPYQFEAEWDAFEFGYHALDSEANVVILTMAWTTGQDSRIFSRRPQDPDLETLVYWVQRLEPLIREDREGEVIVVFCNRCGSEDEVTYAGTSAVLGILQGEVYVYGVLGRGVKDLLVVDTDNLPPSKLTDAASMEAQRQTHETEVAEYLEMDGEDIEEDHVDEDHIDEDRVDEFPNLDPEPELKPLDESRMPDIFAAQQLDDDDDCAIISDDEEEDDGGDYLSPLPTSAIHSVHSQPSPLFAGRMSSLRSQLRLVIPTAPAINDPTPIEIDSAIPNSAMPNSAIPQSAIDDDIIIDSPGVTNPSSPVQYTTLPKLAIPSSPWRFRKKPTPYPWQQPDGPQPQIFGGGKVCMTPITPFDTGSPIVSAKGPQSATWRPAQAISNHIPEAIPEDEVEDATVDSSSNKQPHSGHSSRHHSRQASRERGYNGIIELNSPEKLRYRESKQLGVTLVKEPEVGNKEAGDIQQSEVDNIHKKEQDVQDEARPGDEEHKDFEEEKGDESPVPDLSQISAILERLRLAEGCTPGSSNDNQPPPVSYETSKSPCPERPFSPKSLNASRNQSRNHSRTQSRSRLMQLRDEHIHDPASDERVTSISRGTIPISASPSVFDTEPYYRPQSIPISASPSLFSSNNTDTLNSPIVPAEPVGRPVSRMGHQRRGSKDRVANIRSLSLPAVHETHPLPRSASLAGYKDMSGGSSHQRRRSSLRITTTNLDGEPTRIISRDTSREGSRTGSSSSRRRTGSTSKSDKRHRRRRNVSRGRQPGARGTSVDRSDSIGETRSQVSRRQSLQRRPDTESESPPIDSKERLEKRTRTVSGSGRSGRRRSAAPAPLLLNGPSVLENSRLDSRNPSGIGAETDADTEIEADDVPGGNDNDDDVLIGSIKRIAPDCPHHSPFRRSFRHGHERRHRHHQEDGNGNDNTSVPPPPPLPPVAHGASGNHTLSSSSLLSFAVSHSAMNVGGWTPGGPPLLSASSVEGGFSSNFSESSPMSPDPETPGFFGGGLAQSLSNNVNKTIILSDLVSTSTVTSPSEQIQMQFQAPGVQLIGKAVLSEAPEGAVGNTIGKGDVENVHLDLGVVSGSLKDEDKGPVTTSTTPVPAGEENVSSTAGVEVSEGTAMVTGLIAT